MPTLCDPRSRLLILRVFLCAEERGNIAYIDIQGLTEKEDSRVFYDRPMYTQIVFGMCATRTCNRFGIVMEETLSSVNSLVRFKR